MKTLARQRVVPLRPPKSGRPPKKSNLDPLAARRQIALKSRWDLEKARGKRLKLIRVGGQPSTGSYASQCLQGTRPLNAEWMLHFAREMDLPPQEIWGSDWPFPDLTPNQTSPSLQRLIQRWRTLSPDIQAQILQIAETDKPR
jgi:hypothetical protein